MSAERRRGLGRGLDALLAPERDAGVRNLPIDQLVPSRLQPRTAFAEEALEELTASIRSQGVVQPLVVTPRADGRFDLVAGERRWRAAQRAGLAAVPVVVREVGSERERLELALVENLQRADLNPVEEAEAFRALAESFGLSQEEIAARVGRSRAAVANALRLLRLPEEVLGLLREGRLTAGQARPLLAIEGAERLLALARRAAERGLSAREVEAEAQRQAGRSRRRRPVEAHAAAAAERLTHRLQTKVEIARRRRGGLIKIHFHSEDELMRLFDHLMDKGGRR